MKKKGYLATIIFSTFISVVIMVAFDNYINNSKQYEEGKSLKQGMALHNKIFIPSKMITNDNPSKTVKKNDEEGLKTKYNLEKKEMYQKELNNDYNSKDEKSSGNLNASSANINMRKNNKSKEIYDELYLRRRTNGLENYYYNDKEDEQSVFKVDTGDIEENLTTSDKIKLLYISMKLDKTDYKKVEEYLYAEDAEDGVLKALKLLKEDLSEKEYEKVRKIAIRFIDMDAAERLY
jgi:hypothetical protein